MGRERDGFEGIEVLPTFDMELPTSDPKVGRYPPTQDNGAMPVVSPRTSLTCSVWRGKMLTHIYEG